jgi:glutathione S-transferase
MVSASQDFGELTVFYHPLSQPARAVMCFCAINEIKHTGQFVDILNGGNKKEDFLRINPVGAVPAIREENGSDVFLLNESHAILRYLADSRQTADHWYPKDLKTRARVDKYLDSHYGDVRANTAKYLQNKLFIKNADNIKYFGEKVMALLARLDKTFADQTWIAGTDKPSIADLSAWSELFAQEMAQVDFQVYPNVKAWMDRFVKFDLQIQLTQLRSRNLISTMFLKENLPKLVYFELGGRGEQVRIACAVAGLKFTDERLSFPEFGKRKGEFPTGAIPVWIEDGETYF